MAERRAHHGRKFRDLPRWSLALLSAVHALVFGWGAVALPWHSWTLVAVLTAIHGALHLLVAGLAALGHRWLGSVWRFQSAATLAYLLYLGWGFLSSAWTIRSIYVGLGQGIAAALVGALALIALATLPLACWGIAATGGIRWPRTIGAALLLVLACGAGRLWWLADQARGEPVVDPATIAAVEALLPRTLNGSRLTGATTRAPSLMTRAPVRCPQPPERGLVTLVATYLTEARDDRQPQLVSRCFQASNAATLEALLTRELADTTLTGPVKLDLISRRIELPSDAPLVASLTLRPGLDGLCQGALCLMPWQLIAIDAFTSHQPLAMVPDARLGAAPQALRDALGADPAEGLQAITTHSWLMNPGGQLVTLSRGLPPAIPVTSETVAEASRAAERFVASAQRANGRFRVLVHPFSGQLVDQPFSVGRQAGTTMVACELSPPSPRLAKLVSRSLAALAKLEQRWPALPAEGELGVIASLADRKHPTVRLGASALTLAALLRCRDLTGRHHDAWIGRLARLMLHQQRPDGSFHHRVSTTTGAPTPSLGSLYVDGQALLALVLLEGVSSGYSASFPARPVVQEAVERAMDFFGSRYWDLFVRQLFFVEENWHCIAAAAALDHHRHDAYERFCLDYVAFKRRFIHDEHSGAHQDFLGGYGLANVVPPHNTATAGLGEALAAAVLIKRARKWDVTEDSKALRLIIAFLLRNQRRLETCFACSRRVPTAGGFSEHMASPPIRIDYVQHAWAALGHGARALHLTESLVTVPAGSMRAP